MFRQALHEVSLDFTSSHGPAEGRGHVAEMRDHGE